MRRARRHLKRVMALAASAAIAPAYTGLASLLGQQLYPSDYPWNQPITNAPVAANSAAIISHIGSSVPIHPDWYSDSPTNGVSPLYGIPYNVVHGNTTTKVSVVIDNYPGESDIVAVPIPNNAVIEGDYQNGPNPYPDTRGDSHLIVWDEDNNVGYELYGASRADEPMLFDGTPKTDGKWHAAQETVWHFGTDNFRLLGETSADAAGLSILAGLARPDEGLTVAQGGQGAINHALRFTLPAGDINPQYIYPGSHMVSETQAANNLPLGARLRLKSNSTINALISNMGPQSQAIAHAMQTYGLVLADVGSAMYVTGVSGSVDANNNLNLVWDLNDIFSSTGIKSLTAANFDVVDLRPRVTGLSPSSGPAGTMVTINGQNFSGAAGQLYVSFGAMPAVPVTFIDDSHLQTYAPAGVVGTVDVTVQSGTNETDTVSDFPTANTNNPIFGYGISSLTTSDRFTYGAAPSPKSPTIKHVMMNGANIILSGTNNNGSGGTYHVLASTNLTLPGSNWTVLTNTSFDGSGNFSNAFAATNSLLFFILKVP